MNKKESDKRVLVLIILILGIVSIHFLNIIKVEHKTDEEFVLFSLDNNLVIGKREKITSEGEIPAAFAPFFFEKISVNNAEQQLLETIPGIGPELAVNIISTRKRRGHFKNALDLLEVKGIGEKRKEKFATFLSFD